ncbi:Protein gts1 [Collariella sp. IMI 366227]|nr:Protein gts1 [Collariella sp. IMI 366227]
MSSLSKRQQARNEKALQDLVHSVAGNNFCADCQARNPSWASWSLGIFLCMRCATIHRKLGTHVSKVKSLSMDSWTNEQVDNMRKVGNVVSNRLYNPENKRPSIPIDADEVDSAMERFIRQKYMNRTPSSNKKHTAGSDSDDNPPPLPPKTPSRFNLRSASSIFPLGSRKKPHEPTSPRESQPQPALRNKSSGLFGVTFERDRGDGDDMDRKLAKLRDMGFSDDHKNAAVLKGVGGNLERAIEALVRLGEGGGKTPTLLAPSRAATMPITRSLTPGAGSEAPRARPISPASTNPFDMLDTPPPPQPLSSQSTGTLQNKNPYLSTNPFGAQLPQPSALDMAFQNMSLAPPSQPLFPHHTGGLAQQQNTQNVYQQPLASNLTGSRAPVPQGYSGMTMNGSLTYPQPTQPAPANYNPFFAAQPAQQPLTVNTAQFGGNINSNPFTRSPTRLQSPALSQIPEQTQQNFYAPPAAQPQTTNPFFSQQVASAPQQQQQQQFPGQMQMQMPQQQPQQMQYPQQFQMPQQQQQMYPQQQQMGFAPQTTGYIPQQQQQQRPDKASIMALYGSYPPQQQQQQQPTPSQNPYQQQPAHSQNPYQTSLDQHITNPAAQNSNPYFTAGPFPQQQQQQPQQQVFQPTQQMGVSPPPSQSSRNPFVMGGGGNVVNGAAPKQHNASRESMMASGLDWANGRHSPDAFASLSARDTR